MKLSIALGTFNGGRFLQPQLDSSLAQTRIADELVICDDASTDETLAIATRFAREAPIPVRLEANARRLGSTGNFNRAISLCTGDLIVLADQDDHWLPTKLATIEQTLQQSPDAAFCFSDADVVGEQLEPLGYRLWESLAFGPNEQRNFREGGAFESLLRRHRATGATLAFRAEYRDLLLPIPAGWVHDAWIAFLLSAVAPCELISAPLIQYRQHRGQQHGGRKRSLFTQTRAARTMTRETCDSVADRYEEAYVRLKERATIAPERMELLRRKIEHHRRRAGMRSAGTWRLPHVLSEACRGNYRRYGLGWKTIAQDLLL